MKNLHNGMCLLANTMYVPLFGVVTISMSSSDYEKDYWTAN